MPVTVSKSVGTGKGWRNPNKNSEGSVNLVAAALGQGLEATRDQTRIGTKNQFKFLHLVDQMPDIAQLNVGIDGLGGGADLGAGHGLCQSLRYGGTLGATLQPRYVVPFE